MKKLLCQCFETSSDRATVGSVKQTDKEKPYVLLDLPHKERRTQARARIDRNSTDPDQSTESIFPSKDGLFMGPSPYTTEKISSSPSSVRSSASKDCQPTSTPTSRPDRFTKSDSSVDERWADEGQTSECESQDGEIEDEFDLATKESIAYLVQQKDMEYGPGISPASLDKDSKYNEPALFRTDSSPAHYFEKHPVTRPPQWNSRTRKMSTVRLLRNQKQASDSGRYGTEDGLTPAQAREYRKVNGIIRRLKKQLDPLNYTDFWFTMEQIDGARAFSDAVRGCIARTGAFSHETERLDRWLNVMLLEAREGPRRLDFQLVKDAHLDKMVEEIAEFKSRPPTLPFKELQMVEMASDLLRYWRHRFGNRYYLLDRHRQKIMMDTLVQGLTFKTPTPVTPTGWVPLNAISMSELEAETEFEEGRWWVNLAAAHRDGIVGTQVDKPTKGRFGYTAIPLMTGKEEGDDAEGITYVREDKQRRKVSSLGDVSMLSLLGAKVRLLRGSGLQSVYAPAAGVRYDGLWIVAQYGQKSIPETGMCRLTLRLERSSPRRPMSELTAIPTPAEVDYYRQFEYIDRLLIERAVTAHAHREWHQRRTRLKLAREQWQRLRVFREGLEYHKQRELALAAKAARVKGLRLRISSEVQAKKQSIKRASATATKRSKESSIELAKTRQAAVTPLPDIKIYPGTWERKTLLSAV